VFYPYHIGGQKSAPSAVPEGSSAPDDQSEVGYLRGHRPRGDPGRQTLRVLPDPSYSYISATAKPVLFKVVENTLQGVSKLNIETSTYHLCFNYYNFAGPIKVPLVCMYARKLCQYMTEIGICMPSTKRSCALTCTTCDHRCSTRRTMGTHKMSESLIWERMKLFNSLNG
jgi:hypothetical protein